MNARGGTDLFAPAKRSDIMRAVKSANTKPEILLRKALFARGFRYRLHGRALPGKPDLVLARYRAVIFVHGCFWHGHDCPRGARTPKSNRDYWIAKIARNKARDAKNLHALDTLGWRAYIVWECELRDVSAAANRAARWLAKQRPAP